MADSTVGFLFPHGYLNTKEPLHIVSLAAANTTVTGQLHYTPIRLLFGGGFFKLVGTITLNEVPFDPSIAPRIYVSITKQRFPGRILDSKPALSDSTFEFYGWEEGEYEIVGRDTSGILNSSAKATVRAIPI